MLESLQRLTELAPGSRPGLRQMLCEALGLVSGTEAAPALPVVSEAAVKLALNLLARLTSPILEPNRYPSELASR